MKIDQNTMEILSRVTIEGNKIFLTCGQLDRKQYVAVNKVLETLGGKWARKEGAHLYAEDPTQAFEEIMLSGEIKPPEDYGCFYTPDAVAQQVIDIAEIVPEHAVLEPSAGQAAILKKVPKCARLDCVEFLDSNVKILQSLGYNPIQADFLSITNLLGKYDRIVANPPFFYKGHPQADIDHVSHMVNFLNPGGRIVSVMSAGIVFRQNKKSEAMREFIEAHGEIIPLPEKSFKESGTNVNTIIAVINN